MKFYQVTAGIGAGQKIDKTIYDMQIVKQEPERYFIGS